jgi:hypothetical protein
MNCSFASNSSNIICLSHVWTKDSILVSRIPSLERRLCGWRRTDKSSFLSFVPHVPFRHSNSNSKFLTLRSVIPIPTQSGLGPPERVPREWQPWDVSGSGSQYDATLDPPIDQIPCIVSPTAFLDPCRTEGQNPVDRPCLPPTPPCQP